MIFRSYYSLFLSVLLFVRCTSDLKKDDGFLSLVTNSSENEILLLYKVSDSLMSLRADLQQEAVRKLAGNINRGERAYSKLLFLKSSVSPDAEAAELLKTAIGIAEQSDEERLVAAYCRQYSTLLYRQADYKTSVLYGVKSVELQGKIGFQYFPRVPQFKLAVARVLYNTRNYSESIRYYHVLFEEDLSSLPDDLIASSYNTFAFCYKDQGLYDSAMILYQRAWEFAKRKKIPVWTWLLRGNQAYIHLAQHRYDSAENIARRYYDECMNAQAWTLAAKAQTIIARAQIGKGNYVDALPTLLKADSIITHYPMRPYEEHSATYQTLALVYENMGASDKAYTHYKKYILIRDSVERSINQTTVENFKTRLDFDRAEASIRLLQQEKKAERLQRNFIIGLIGLSGVISLLLLNRQRLRLLHKNQLALQQKKVAESEAASARKELQLFTTNLVEKNKLIDLLQEQLQEERIHQDVQEKLGLLKQQVILTEEDWKNFRTVFEKVYPRFFEELRKMAPDITVAEQRMAALIRLFPENRQIALVLGISVDSVRKTKRRLSQRLCIDTEQVEQLMLNLG